MVSMVLSNFGYSLREAFRHMRRNWSTCLGAIVTIFLSLLIIGVFVLGSSMLNNMVGAVENRVTIQAFLKDGADQAKVDTLKEQIASWENVQSVTYRSKEENLKEYKETMSNKNAADAIAALDGQNPIPASLVIKLNEPKQVATTAEKLIADPSFAEVCDGGNAESSVQYGRETVQRLFSVTNYLRIGAIALVGLLTFVAFVFINNTIRLAISARRREIAIERLVGASNGFIRGPFIMEGALEALFGAVFAVVVLHFGFQILLEKMQNSLPFLSLGLSQQTMLQTYGLLVGVGVLIGLLGSAIAMRRFLRV